MIEIKFAENLKQLRTLRHLSQAELAKMVGVDQRTISAWENSICEPDFNTLAKLCHIFNETFDNLLT